MTLPPFLAELVLRAVASWMLLSVFLFPLLAPVLVAVVEGWRKWFRTGRLLPLLRLVFASLLVWASMTVMLIHCMALMDNWDSHNPNHHARALWLAIWWLLFGAYVYANRARLKRKPIHWDQ